MAQTTFNNIKISGLACAVPEKKIKTTDYDKYFGKEDVEKFINMVGVKERYISIKEQTGSDLCYIAAKKLLEHKNYDSSSIDAIIFVAQIPDYKEPATAHVLHKRLGLKKDCIAFDINLGCTGFIYGITVLSTLINSGLANRGLLLVGEVSKATPITNDHSNTMMFGDAGSACIIEQGHNKINSLLKSDGNGFNIMGIPGGQARFPINKENPDWDSLEPRMDGFEVFKFAITTIPKTIKEFFNIFNTNLTNFDYYIFHQANKFMLEHIANKAKIPNEKMPLSIDRFGNTNGVSIPITIVDLINKNNIPNILNFLTCAFGVGLSWGVVSFKINKDDILPMIYSDEYYEEAYSIKIGKTTSN